MSDRPEIEVKRRRKGEKPTKQAEATGLKAGYFHWSNEVKKLYQRSRSEPAAKLILPGRLINLRYLVASRVMRPPVYQHKYRPVQATASRFGINGLNWIQQVVFQKLCMRKVIPLFSVRMPLNGIRFMRQMAIKWWASLVRDLDGNTTQYFILVSVE